MKNKASVFLKQFVSTFLVTSIAKAKSMAVKSKTSAAKARLIMFALMKSKKTVLLGSISDKIHGLLGDKETREEDREDDQSKAIVPFQYDDDDDDDEEDQDDNKYPDLTHCLFDEVELDQLQAAEAEGGGSIIEMVKNSKEGEGEDFSLEDEIDHVADLFITKFYKQMRLQKLLSFKRHQEMLERSV